MARKKKQEEHVNLERWLVSYADFITLLFAFFVVMYAMSSTNEGKYKVLSQSLIAAFDTPPKSIDPINIGTPTSSSPAIVIRTEALGEPGSQDFDDIHGQLKSALSELSSLGEVGIENDGVRIEVVINTSLLFHSGSAKLVQKALPPLKKLADILAKYPNPLEVEGFTDNIPINTVTFPSNWELSASRAASVVSYFSTNGVSPERMAAVGYGEHRPIASNDTAEGRKKNRRVVIVILNPEAYAGREQKVEAESGQQNQAEFSPFSQIKVTR